MPQSWETKVVAIQEAKKMNEITLDELIGNLHTCELRRSAQVKEEAKRDRGLALKALESDDSNLDFEEIAMMTQKFKKFSKKAEGNIKKGRTRKPRNSDHDRFSRCFRYGKFDHIVQNCPIQKEEQGSE